MNDISELDITGKEMAVLVLVVFVFMVVVFSAGYMLGIRNVHDNGSGTQPITNELGQVGTAIENAGAGINEAQGHAGNVQAGIDNAAEQAGYIHSTATTSAGIVAECQQIIKGIRARGKTDPPAN